MSLDTQLICYEWGKAPFPVSNRLIREFKATFREYLSQIAQTQLLPQPPQNDKQDHIGRIFQKVERGSGTLVKGSPAI
jgi:hypothetical protein